MHYGKLEFSQKNVDSNENKDNEGEGASLKIIRNSLDELTKTAIHSLRSYKEFLYQVLQELQEVDNKTKETNKLVNITAEPSPPAPDSDVNSEEKVQNTTTEDPAPNVNFTDSASKKKVTCVGKNVTENTTAEVRIVDSVVLHEKLNPKNDSEGTCTLVMFYAPWCIFCARTAPHYNALARAFPQMDVLAIDAVHFSSLNARYGTIAVPNIMVFHGGRPVTRFNQTERTLENFITFVANITGFKPVPGVNVTEPDFLGPLPSEPTDSPDYLLFIAWIFVICCVTYMVIKSNYGQHFWQKVQHLWHEHQHLD